MLSTLANFLSLDCGDKVPWVTGVVGVVVDSEGVAMPALGGDTIPAAAALVGLSLGGHETANGRGLGCGEVRKVFASSCGLTREAGLVLGVGIDSALGRMERPLAAACSSVF